MSDRIFKPKHPYTGKVFSLGKLDGGLKDDFKRVQKATKALDLGITDAQSAADAAAAKAGKKSAVLDGANKTSTGDAFTVTSFTPLTGFEQAITTHGGAVKVHADVGFTRGTDTPVISLRLTEDGVAGSNQKDSTLAGTSGTKMTMSIEEVFSPAAGAHTYRLEGMQNLGSNTPTVEKGILTVIEIRDEDP